MNKYFKYDMKAKIIKALTKIKNFCSAQSLNFYAGMVFAAFGILTVIEYSTLLTSVILSPVLTFIMYTLGRLIHEPFKILKTVGFWQDILAVFLGNLWVLLFIFI